MPLMLAEFGVTGLDGFKAAMISPEWKVPPGTHQTFLEKGDRVLMMLTYDAASDAAIKEV